jgi:hypothetical protein
MVSGTMEGSKAHREPTGRLLFRLPKAMFCEMTSTQLMVIARSAERASKCAKELAARYVKTKPKQPPAFYLVSIHDEVHAQRVEVSQPFAMTNQDLALHYGDEFLEFERQFIGALHAHSSGASILRGEPGTGKTSFLRHLIAKLESSHRFYYLPVGETHRSPEQKKVVILEDAEDLLMMRSTENRAKVSDLLNVADGFLGEFLKMHVICTINCSTDRLDPAILRAGRLVAYREFKRLSREQAGRVAAIKGVALWQKASRITRWRRSIVVSFGWLAKSPIGALDLAGSGAAISHELESGRFWYKAKQ